MKVKNAVLSVLENNRGSYINGAFLASELNVSRNAVWKAVVALKEEGYDIVSVPRKGYCLLESSTPLSKEAIKLFLDSEYSDTNILVYKSVASTNLTAKALVMEGARERTVIIAESQTNGRGRSNRVFFSPDKSGLYMSIILKPNESISYATRYTIYAAVAAYRTIREYSEAVPSIKWVNDIYIENKKCCGILTEATTEFETQKVESLIIGIGVNISTRNFPDNIKNIACSVSENDINRNEFAAKLINNLFLLIDHTSFEDVITEYKAHNYVLGKTVTYVKNGTAYEGTATDIDDAGHLIVDCGTFTDNISNGEVSLKDIF